MKLVISPEKKISSRHVAVAAESIAASHFALCGFDVLEHAGQARSAYDLGVAKSGGMMKLSVHASLSAAWNLVEPHLTQSAGHNSKAAYHRAIDLWQMHQRSNATCCLVQFDSGDLRSMPSIYLASPVELATRLHETVEEQGSPVLYGDNDTAVPDKFKPSRSLPTAWRFSEERIAELMDPEAVVVHARQEQARPARAGAIFAA